MSSTSNELQNYLFNLNEDTLNKKNREIDAEFIASFILSILLKIIYIISLYIQDIYTFFSYLRFSRSINHAITSQEILRWGLLVFIFRLFRNVRIIYFIVKNIFSFTICLLLFYFFLTLFIRKKYSTLKSKSLHLIHKLRKFQELSSMRTTISDTFCNETKAYFYRPSLLKTRFYHSLMNIYSIFYQKIKKEKNPPITIENLTQIFDEIFSHPISFFLDEIADGFENRNSLHSGRFSNIKLLSMHLDHILFLLNLCLTAQYCLHDIELLDTSLSNIVSINDSSTDLNPQNPQTHSISQAVVNTLRTLNNFKRNHQMTIKKLHELELVFLNYFYSILHLSDDFIIKYLNEQNLEVRSKFLCDLGILNSDSNYLSINAKDEFLAISISISQIFKLCHFEKECSLSNMDSEDNTPSTFELFESKVTYLRNDFRINNSPNEIIEYENINYQSPPLSENQINLDYDEYFVGSTVQTQQVPSFQIISTTESKNCFQNIILNELKCFLAQRSTIKKFVRVTEFDLQKQTQIIPIDEFSLVDKMENVHQPNPIQYIQINSSIKSSLDIELFKKFNNLETSKSEIGFE